jgi:type IV secretory pathway VirB6-like protein
VSTSAGGSDPANPANTNVKDTVVHPMVPRTAERAGAPRSSTSGPSSRSFTSLKWTSFFHSCVYTSLLLCAFALGKPQPVTLVLGWTHGLVWIGMSLACITAARMRIVSLRLAVAVAVLGGIGPFFGSYEFVREQRLRAR